MSVYIPLLAGVFPCLAFLLASPYGTCDALQTAGAVPARLLAGRVGTGRSRLDRLAAMLLSFRGHRYGY